MSLLNHLASLKKKFETLNTMIASELARPHPDSLRVSTLKRKKLQVKQQLTYFQQ